MAREQDKLRVPEKDVLEGAYCGARTIPSCSYHRCCRENKPVRVAGEGSGHENASPYPTEFGMLVSSTLLQQNHGHTTEMVGWGNVFLRQRRARTIAFDVWRTQTYR